MKVFSNLHFEGSSPVIEMLSSFPIEPVQGQLVLKDGVVYIYTTISGIVTWYPLTNTTNHYIHSQGINSTEWIISHNLGTADLIFFAYKADGSYVEGTLVPVDDNTFKIKFSVAITGKVVVFAAGEVFSSNINTESVNTSKIVNSETSNAVFTFLANGDIVYNGIIKPTTGSSIELYSYKDITAGYTASTNDYLNLDSTTGPFTVALPAVHNKNDVVFVSTGSSAENNNITVGGNGSDIKYLNLQDTTFVLDVNTVEIKFKSNGTFWEVF